MNTGGRVIGNADTAESPLARRYLTPQRYKITEKTVNSAGSGSIFIQILIIRANPLKYTDPDGKTPKMTLEIQIESAVKVMVFLYQNKDSIKKAGEGTTKIAEGLGVASLGVGGGAGITIGSGGTAALGGVALADAAIVTGGALVGAGATDILNSIVLMVGDGHWRRENKNSQKSYNQNDWNEIQKALKKINQETGRNIKIGTHERDAIHKAIRDMKAEVNPPGTNQNLSQENLQKAIKYALNIE
jgi:hypothetical protein